MMNKQPQGIVINTLKAIIFLVSTALIGQAQAQFPMFPPAPWELYAPAAPDYIVGSYTVDWQDTSGSICWLSEKVNNGSWVTVPNTYSPTKTINLSRGVGSYEYQVACIDSYGGKLGPVASMSVVSSIPTLDPLATQRGYQYQIRSGDLNADGKKDIYIQRTSGGNSNNGVIDKAIVVQNSDGRFDAIEAPSSGQLSIGAGWPIASGVTAQVNDFNVDGRVDVLLNNLDSAISNVDDQILYSTGEFFNGAAKAATALDFEFQKFFRDSYNWILDPNYFNQAITSNMPAYNFSLEIGVYFCSYWYGFPTCLNVGHGVFNQTVTLERMGLSGYETIAAAEEGLASALGFASYDTFECVLVCGWIEFYGWYSSTIITFWDVWTPTTESPGFDDINFSAWARDVADISDDITTGAISDSVGLERILEIFEDLTDIKIGGICIGGLVSDPELQDPEDCQGFELFATVANTAPETDQVEKRQPNIVYITGHRVGWVGPFHLAVEYSTSPTQTTTFSAGPVEDELVSGINRASDISGNVTIGISTSSSGLSPSPYFLHMTSKYDNYDNGLNYDLFPQQGTDGYNSNSYVHGLVKAANGVSSVNLNNYIGGDKPVPTSEFD